MVLTRALHARGARPNQISIASVLFALLGALMLLATSDVGGTTRAVYFVLAIVGIQGRLLCNLLDGMLAIEAGLKSKSGEIYNELPDRLSDLLILLAAGMSIRPDQLSVVSGATLGWIAATLAILTAYVRAMGAAAGTPHFFVGPMAKPHRMALLTGACALSAPGAIVETGMQWLTMPWMIIALSICIAGSLLTIARRTILIIRYLEAQ